MSLQTAQNSPRAIPLNPGEFLEPPKRLSHAYVSGHYRVHYGFVQSGDFQVMVAVFRSSDPLAKKNGVPYCPPTVHYLEFNLWQDSGVVQVKPSSARVPHDEQEHIALLEQIRAEELAATS